MTYSAPKTPPPSTITQETRFQHVNFRGDTNIQPIADGNLKTSCRRNQKVGIKTGLGVGKRQSEVDWLSQVPICHPQYSGAIYNRRDVCCSGLKQKTLITQRCWHLSQYLHQEKSSTFTNYFEQNFKFSYSGEKNAFQGPISWPSWCNYNTIPLEAFLFPSFNLEIKHNNEKFIPGLLGLSPFQNVFSLLPSNSQFYLSVSLPEVSEYTG